MAAFLQNEPGKLVRAWGMVKTGERASGRAGERAIRKSAARQR
jgi:hypothetical protein